MSFCTNCGSPIQDDFDFCPECGTRVNIPDENYDECYSQYDTGPKRRCPKCGEMMPADLFFCLSCGYQFPIQEHPEYHPDENFNDCNTMNQVQGTQEIWKNKWIALLLCIFLGGLGIHRFYEGKVFTGLLYLFSFGLLGVGWIIDIFRIALKPNPYRVK